jgi:diadenosine tetraphosphatase ApaH/serine/threonine PP2A family protein phosphatase
MKAILSDIHGNLEALRAVLADIAHHGAEVIYCLGDVVGYGPDPRACLDLARTWPVVLLGNHDHGISAGPDDFNVEAARALLWTAGQLQQPVPSPQAAEERLAFLASLPFQHCEGDFFFVHASPRDPLFEYIFPEDTFDRNKMQALFSCVDRYCFQGHTHVPGVFSEALTFRDPPQLGYEYRLGQEKVMVNVGSVGQPRDGDWRACYVLLEDDWIFFRRVEYDVQATVAKIRAIVDLPPRLADRLLRGE